MMEFGIVIGVLIVLKLFFWLCYFSVRRRRVESTAEALRQLRALQMAEAGLIHPAPTPGSRYPPIVTRGQAPGVHAQPNNNTTKLTPNAIGGTKSEAAPPSYQEAMRSPSLPQEAPPAFTEKSS
ncbi:uncharacterized protein [Littorina saxatilis]|uniref:Uncharacterized protein n=1 Tax=Littorina saxatilis TaxID=31220 RepID=A0AAN9GMB7_9CAEN